MSKGQVLITGAGSGIGRALTERFLKDGWKVWGTSRKGQIHLEHPDFQVLKLDLGETASIRGMVSDFRTQAGTLDILINNAGSGRFASLEDMSSEEQRREFEVLFFGPMELTRQLLPDLRKSKGLLINITSMAAMFPIPFMGTYSAAKAALSSATETLQMELTGSGVRILDLMPGDINTPFHDAMDRGSPSDDYRLLSDKVYAAVEKSMRSAPPPERVAMDVAALIEMRPPPLSRTTGSFWQASLGPIARRLLPQRWMQAILKQGYNLDTKE